MVKKMRFSALRFFPGFASVEIVISVSEPEELYKKHVLFFLRSISSQTAAKRVP
jgi:hypothetical protein